MNEIKNCFYCKKDYPADTLDRHLRKCEMRRRLAERRLPEQTTPKLGLSKQWECPICTFENEWESTLCDICRAGKRPSASDWQCSRCTFQNSLILTHCQVCSKARDQPICIDDSQPQSEAQLKLEDENEQAEEKRQFVEEQQQENECERIENELETEEPKTRDNKMTFSDRMKCLKEKIERMRQENESLKNCVDQAKAENGGLRMEIVRMRSQHNTEVKGLRLQVDEAKRQIASLSETNQLLEHRISEEREIFFQKVQPRNQNSEIVGDINELKIQVERLRRMIEENENDGDEKVSDKDMSDGSAFTNWFKSEFGMRNVWKGYHDRLVENGLDDVTFLREVVQNERDDVLNEILAQIGMEKEHHVNRFVNRLGKVRRTRLDKWLLSDVRIKNAKLIEKYWGILDDEFDDVLSLSESGIGQKELRDLGIDDAMGYGMRIAWELDKERNIKQGDVKPRDEMTWSVVSGEEIL